MPSFFTKKRVVWTVIAVLILVVIGFIVFGRKNAASGMQTAVVTRQDVEATVLSTGQVTSRIDLDLAFQGSGVVKRVNIVEGSVVKAGQVLAVLDQGSAAAALTSAQGTLAQAQANEEKVAQGSTNEQIAVAQKAVDAAQVALDNAMANAAAVQAQQDTAVQNAAKALFNTAFTAVPGTANLDGIVATISGTYAGSREGTYAVWLYHTAGGMYFATSGLEQAVGYVSTQPVPFGTHGLFIQFDRVQDSDDTWTITVPNTHVATYTTNENAYQAALRARDTAVATAQAGVASADVAQAQAQASVAQVKAQATSAEIAVAKAAVLIAQGGLQSAQVALNSTVLIAPVAGTVTQVDVKVGEQAVATKEVMVLQDVSELHAEAQVSEADIASLQKGQAVEYTFDALGPDRHFAGAVLRINPASTVISGVVDYKVSATIEHAPDIKPGMTANMTILAAKKTGVLVVPSGAVVNKDGANFVRVVDDASKGTYHQVRVETGLLADDGLVEITSGLDEGQAIVTYLPS